MKIRILFFAHLRDAFKKDECEMEIENAMTVGRLVQTLFKNEKLESLSDLPILFAVNEDYAKPDRILSDGDVLALIPPVAGG